MKSASDFRCAASYAQQRLWFLDRLSPGSVLYVIPLTLRLTSGIDVAALARSLNEIVRRHESLRTTFDVQDETLLQVVGSSLAIDLPLVDLQHLDPDGREAAVRELVAWEAAQPFDLTTGPLLRAKLFCLSPCDHLLFVGIHHIVADGWSLGLLLTELREIYPAFIQGLPSPLPDLPIQYADYAAWQRRRLEGPVLHEELSYWRQQLAGLPALALPAGRRTAAPASRLAMSVAPETVATLSALGRREGATLFMTLLAGFQALLHRYSGQEDFGVGTVIANRTRAETEALIGCFVNTLVIRARVQGTDTFRNLLRTVRETTLSAYAHQELPFERLIEDLRPSREAGRTPLVQILFSLQNAPSLSRHPAGQMRTSWEVDRGSAHFDLTVDLWDTPDGLESRWEYRPEQFDGETVEQLMRHYQRLLDALAADLDRPIAHVSMLDADERRALLLRGTGPSVAFPARPIHRCISDRTREWSDRIAASNGTETITYAGLQTRAARLATELRRRGVGRRDVIAICVPRSPSFGVGVLGVLGAGAAFFAMDPGDPALRRTGLLAAVSARAVVTNSSLASRLDFTGIDVVCVDVLDRLDAKATERVDEVPADELAYVVCTSGSTGIPKGILIPHGALANHCHAVAARYDLGPDDRVLQLAPTAFDVALEEMLPVWLTGGTVHFPVRDGALSFADLERCVERQQITVLNLPASYWHEWVDHLSRTNNRLPPSLRLVICGSERVSTAKLRRWQELPGNGVRWLNAYGVTEATITSTLYEPARPAPDDLPNIVPIGHPLPNVHTLVLDEAGELVPPGVAGELHIGGSGLALGYLNQPELTRERFIPSPFESAPGARLYRTGDLVRVGRDGALEFLGRRDTQVKIRGHRIELGEIEAVLMRQPGVREAIVQEPLDGHDRLIAYIVPDDARPPDAAVLAAYARTCLPAHMVPASFVMLEALRRSATGKIDRTALPRAAEIVPATARVTPRTALEVQLSELWAGLLNVPEVGITDNFFELGGHSLLAMQLLSRVQVTLAIEIPLGTLFETPTVAGLAAAIGKGQAGTAQSPASSMTAASRLGREILALDVEQLSDDEVDACLTELLAGGHGR